MPEQAAIGALLAAARSPHRFRVHQRQALDAVGAVQGSGTQRAWVVLPPGAGKTLVGLEVARRRGRPAVVLGPNTAIQSQWVAGWDSFLGPQAHPRLRATRSRDLPGFLTALTYQSLATFDTEAESDEAGEQRSHLAALHPNGVRLVERLRAVGDLTLVLDECHHLLEVWGELLLEVLEHLPDAFVLGLTATPPQLLNARQQVLVDELFGDAVFEASIPAVVREGDLAPFAELAWLTTPTAREQDWLAAQGERFAELTTALTDPGFGSVPFLTWLRQRFAEDSGSALSWHQQRRQEPELCDAALRMVGAELLDLPTGARLGEEHRRPPDADDWVRLLDDWLRASLLGSADPGDVAAVAAVRQALPSVGYQLTRQGIRRGRSPVDRVLARSEAKTGAVPHIVSCEHRNLGDRLRMLVLCDHERATATLPADLAGVLAEEAGSARLVLEGLVAEVPDLHPLLVTGRTVAGRLATITALRDFVAEGDALLADGLAVAEAEAGVCLLAGSWSSRDWVRWVTRFFESGRCQVLVGTRGLLGEGWDARSVTGLVDLTAATTSTSVIQTRGRALRVDPDWPEKVALNWSVVCVTEAHPKGANDWQRFVRKHEGFYGVDVDGDVVAGVGHVDPDFSPYAAPGEGAFDAVNARMLVRSEDRRSIRESWRVGEPYTDTLVHTVRIRPSRALAEPGDATVPAVVLHGRTLDVREASLHPWRPYPVNVLPFVLGLVAVVLGGPTYWGLAGLAGSMAMQLGVAVRRGGRIVAAAARPPSVAQLAAAVADGLVGAGLSPRGAEAVGVELDEEGCYRCVLTGVTPEVSSRFATALEEVVSPMVLPRYVLPRWVVAAPAGRPTWRGLSAAFGLLRPDGEVWHTVPSVLAANARSAQAFARAWDHWVGGGAAVYTGSPEGEGVLVTHRGRDPFDVTTVLRTHWR